MCEGKPLSPYELELSVRYFDALHEQAECRKENERLSKLTACPVPIEEDQIRLLRQAVKSQDIDTSEMSDAEVMEEAGCLFIEIFNNVIEYMNREVCPQIVDFMRSIADWYSELPEEIQEALSK